jgi:hypothetical protein
MREGKMAEEDIDITAELEAAGKEFDKVIESLSLIDMIVNNCTGCRNRAYVGALYLKYCLKTYYTCY